MKQQVSITVTVLATAIQVGVAVLACILVGVLARGIWELFMIGFTLFYTIE